jgi:plastocyanin
MTVDQKKKAELTVSATNKGLFSRAPLAAFGRVTVAALLGGGIASGILALIIGSSSFLQSSVTVPKGSKLLLVDNGSFFHILANGTWQNGTPKPANEAGAPAVNNVQVTGGTIEIGPFNTAGTYQIYCTVHPGMDLTVIVQ